MCEVTDEDFLAALENPWLFAAATQSADATQSPAGTPSTTAPVSPPSAAPAPAPAPAPVPASARPRAAPHPDDNLSPSGLLAAQGRRRAVRDRIDAALAQWTPTLRDTFPAEPPAPAAPVSAEGKPAPTAAAARARGDVAKKESAAAPDSNSARSSTASTDATVALEPAALDSFRRDADSTGRPPAVDGLRAAAPAPPSDAPDCYQQAAIDAAKAGRSFFLTGSAGTGKSYVLKRIIRELRDQGRRVAVTASTGCAAVGIQGCTIHSLAGVGLGLEPVERLARRGQSDSRLRDRFQALHALVIDEISMIDSFLFDKIEAVIRAARAPHPTQENRGGFERSRKRMRNGFIRREGAPYKNVAFGGLQVVVCGDFLQLPPVGASDRRYENSSQKFFAFDSLAWKKTIKSTFILRVVHRQSDRKFVGLLNELRKGIVSDCTRRVLNACYISSARNIEADEDGTVVHFTRLYAYRRQVSAENMAQLMRLGSQGVRYVARDFVDRGALGSLTVRIAEQMLQNKSAPDSIELRKGARVICLKNLDAKNGIVNGAAGVIVGWALSLVAICRKRNAKYKNREMDFPTRYDLWDEDVMDLDHDEIKKALEEDDVRHDKDGCLVLSHGKLGVISPVVRFDNGKLLHMSCESWDAHGMRGQVIAQRTQVPLLLGWALSIHKAQGMTLGEVETDVGRAFDYGQVYVALSRATSVHGLRLRSFDKAKVVTHDKVVDFYRDLEER